MAVQATAVLVDVHLSRFISRYIGFQVILDRLGPRNLKHCSLVLSTLCIE